jgi:hypothetical protein
MSFNWPSEGVSITLLPAGLLGDEIFDLAVEWTSHHLLVPSIYVKVDEQGSSAFSKFEENGPQKIIAHVIGRDGEVEVSLIDELTRNDSSLLRVGACRLITASEAFHEKQDQLVDRIREQITLSAPKHEKDGSSYVGTKLLLMNLIAGSSKQDIGSTERLLELDWDVNVVFSSEDRPTPTGFDSFTIDKEEKFPGFMLSNIASTLGLWSGINKSVLELSDIEKSTTYDKVLVQRTFARVVKTEGVAVKMAASALKQIEDFGNPIVDPTFELRGKERLEEKETAAAISKLVQSTLEADNGALSFNLEPFAGVQGVTKVRFLDGVKMFFSFLWQKIVSFPRNLIESMVEIFNRKSTELLFGEDSGYVVGVERDLEKLGLNRKDNQDLIKIEQVKNLVQSKLEEMSVTPTYRADHPGLWSTQRNFVIDILDGSLEGYKGKVLADTEKLIPKYGNVWEVPSFVLDPDEDPEQLLSTLDWLDADAAVKLKSTLDDEVILLQKEATDYGLEFVEFDKEKQEAKLVVRQIRNFREKTADRERMLGMMISEIGVSSDE